MRSTWSAARGSNRRRAVAQTSQESVNRRSIIRAYGKDTRIVNRNRARRRNRARNQCDSLVDLESRNRAIIRLATFHLLAVLFLVLVYQFRR